MAPGAVRGPMTRLADRLARLGRIKLGAVVALGATNVVAVARPDLTPADLAAVATATFLLCYLPLLLCAVLSEVLPVRAGTGAAPPGACGDQGEAAAGSAGKAIRRTTTNPLTPDTSATTCAPDGSSQSGANTYSVSG